LNMDMCLRSTEIIDWKHPEVLEIWPDPLPVVVDALRLNNTWDELWENLPDIELLTANRQMGPG
jgi:hypothetical protein